ANSARELAETRATFVEELQRKNNELEAFSYSVSHDLRGPLRGINGFSTLLLEEYSDQLGVTGQEYLLHICEGTQRMGHLIDDLIALSRVSRTGLGREPVNLSSLVHDVIEDLRG